MIQFKQFLAEAYTIRPTSRDELKVIKDKYTDEQYAEIEALWDFIIPLTVISNPLIFDDGNQKVVKVHKDTDLGDGKVLTHPGLIDKVAGFKKIKVGSGTGSVSKNNDEYYIPPGQTATKFYEQWSSIGIIQTEYSSDTIGRWMKELPDLGNTTSTIAGNIFKLYKENYAKVQGQKDFTDKLPGHYPTIVAILLGSSNVKGKYTSFFSSGGITVVNGDIDNYYSAMKTYYPDQVDRKDKENTADAVVFNGGLTVDGLLGEPISFDNKGVISFPSGQQMLQISMKKGKETARIGKIKDLLTAWEVWSPDKKTTKLKSYMDLFNQFHPEQNILLDEGVLDWIKTGYEYAKEGASKLVKSITSIFSKISKSAISIARRYNFRRETDDLLRKYSRYIIEAKGKTQEEQMVDMAKNPTVIGELNKDLAAGKEKVKGIIVGINSTIDFPDPAIKYLSFPIEELTAPAKFDDVRMVFFNILSFDILAEILEKIESSKTSYQEALDRFVGMFRSSVMGNTKLPVIKVYGVSSATDNSHEVFLHADFQKKQKAVSERIQGQNMSLGGLKLNVQEHYYVIYFYVAGELKGEGANAFIYYNNVRPTAYGGLQFKVEIDSTVDEDTFIAQFSK